MHDRFACTGTLKEKTHILPLRVYYAATDAGGVVHHSSYLNFAEAARTEWLRCLGYDQLQLQADFGLIFAVRSCEIDYALPAKLEDLLAIETRLVKIGGASLDLEQALRRKDADGEKTLVFIKLTLVAMNKDGKAMRIPDKLRNELQNYLMENV